MPNLSSLAPITTSALSLSNLVLVSPQSTVGYQPQNQSDASSSIFDDISNLFKQLPAKLLFHYEGEQSVTVESDITDHYVEDNTAVQDQITIKPEMITVHGFIGELNDVPPDFLAPVKFIADKLVTIGAYEPQLSTTALIAYNEAFLLYQTANTAVNAAVSAWESVGNLVSGNSGQNVVGSSGITDGSVQNKQQTRFNQFYGYWRNRTLFSVQTPWAVFQNMAIKSLKAVQDADTNTITDFEITFKMIRTASTKTSSPLSVGRNAAQGSSEQNNGTSSPVSSTSLDSGLTSMGAQ